jgi:integrase/recombinase XerD
MTDLDHALGEYLAVRRALGYRLERDGKLLPDFIDFLQRAGAERITSDLALRWAMQPATAQPAWWRSRLTLVRGFARYLHPIDPASEIPPQDLLKARRTRITPYLYSAEEIDALMAAASKLKPVLRAATFRTVIGLMSVTGIRIGEAIALDRVNVDLQDGVVRVRGKRGHEREVALHPTTSTALGDYRDIRERHWPQPATPAFFLSSRGERVLAGSFHDTFRVIVKHAGLEGRGERCRPRPHDLRHSMAVRTLIGWYRAGENVDAKLPLLCTYLGHRDPASTYWYLQASPELLALAAERLSPLQTNRSEDRR